MLQPEVGDKTVYRLAEKWFWVGGKVKRAFHNQYEMAMERGLRQIEDHLNLAVRNGEIGQAPFYEGEKIKISNISIQSLVDKFRDVIESGFDKKIFDNIFDQFSKDGAILMSNINTFEIDIDLAIASKLSESYRDIARPILAIILSEYHIAIQKGEEEAKRKLLMTDESELHMIVKLCNSIVNLFIEEVKTKCKELGFEIMEKTLEKIQANSGKKIADKISQHRSTDSALPVRAFKATSSPSSLQRNVSATIVPKACQSNNAVQHLFPQLSPSSSAASGQHYGLNVATNNQKTPDCVMTASSVSSSSSIVGSNSSRQTVQASRSSKRPRLSAGSYAAYYDDEPENLRQIEDSLYISDESYEDSPVSRPSKSTKRSNYKIRYNYQERVTDFLGQGIKVSRTEIVYHYWRTNQIFHSSQVSLYQNNPGMNASVNLGTGRKLNFYFSKYLVSVAKLKYGEQIYIKLQLGPDFSYLIGEVVDESGRGRGARLVLSKEKFEQSNGTNRSQKMHQFHIDPDRAECVQNIHEIITTRSNSA